MTHVVVFRPEAEAEILEARNWYEERREGLGVEFGEAVDELITRISASPFSFPAVHEENRRAVLRRFPFAIYFRATPSEVVVLALHGRQNPTRWQSRI